MSPGAPISPWSRQAKPPRDLRYLQTTAAPVPAGHTEPGSDPALAEALNELEAIDNPADDEVLCVHLGSNTVTRLTSHTLGAATPGPPLWGGVPGVLHRRLPGPRPL